MDGIVDLCSVCAAKMGLSGYYKLWRHPRAVNQKVYCAQCRRTRFGATYTVTEKEDPYAD